MAEFLHKHVAPSGGDYTSLEACMNANEQNLTGDGWFTVEISGDWTGAPDTSACTIHNYTCPDADNNVRISTVGDSRHNGIMPGNTGANAKAYLLNYNVDREAAITISSNYIQITGICFKNSYNSFNNRGVVTLAGGTNFVFDTCIITATYSGEGSRGFYDITAGDSYTFKNSIVYGFTYDVNSYGLQTNTGDNTALIYNNTFVGNNQSIGASPNDARVINNLFADCITSHIGIYYNETSAYIDYNWFDTAEVFNYGYGGSHNINTDTAGWDDVIFVDAANKNFHLAASGGADKGPWGNGIVLTGVTLDIDGTSRGSVSDPCDIGADEYFAPTNFSRGDYASLPTTAADLENIYTAGEVTQVATDDTNRVSQSAISQYAIHQYKKDVGANTTWTVKWNGQSSLAPSTSVVKLQIYDRDGTTWEDLDEDNATGANTDFDLTATISADADHYKDGTIITCRVYQNWSQP